MLLLEQRGACIDQGCYGHIRCRDMNLDGEMDQGCLGHIKCRGHIVYIVGV